MRGGQFAPSSRPLQEDTLRTAEPNSGEVNEYGQGWLPRKRHNYPRARQAQKVALGENALHRSSAAKLASPP